MIVKKVPTSKNAPPKSKAYNVRALVDYIAGPNAGGDGEKIEHRGAMNVLALDHEGQVQEMIDLAEVAKRSPQPVQHWILSWREGEHPTPAQADAAVATFVREMGLADHQVVYALHRDTENYHLHLAVNRVHPETEKVVTVNNGFDHEVAHRAIARIELEQRWLREDRGLFVVRADGELERARSRDDRQRQPTTRARDFEHRTGERSAQRIAAEVAAPIIRAARNWGDLHQALGREGLRFERKGSGAILWVGDEPVKASTAGRECSMAALSKRLGDFRPDLAPSRSPPRRAPEPVESRAASWNRYAEERSRDTAARAAARGRVVERHRDERQHMTDRQRAERARVLRGSWRGRGDLLNATRSLLAATHAQEKADLRDRQKRERATELARERFPMFREWLQERSPGESDRRRHRDRSSLTIDGYAFVAGEPQDIRAFMAAVDGGRVHFYRARDQHAAFTDRGKVIEIHHATDRASVLAALQLSAQKWGTVVVYGNERFKRLCADLAQEHGLRIANPELRRAMNAAESRGQKLDRDR